MPVLFVFTPPKKPCNANEVRLEIGRVYVIFLTAQILCKKQLIYLLMGTFDSLLASANYLADSVRNFFTYFDEICYFRTTLTVSGEYSRSISIQITLFFIRRCFYQSPQRLIVRKCIFDINVS
jgi:hypothetical protein